MKLSGSYESLINGVSQQVPQKRRPGQHHEQVNMISDPVRGLSRRAGSTLVGERRRSLASTTPEMVAGRAKDVANHKVLQFKSAGKEYDLIYRSQPVADDFPFDDRDGFLFCFNRTDGKFIDINFQLLSSTTNALIDSLAEFGVSSAVNVGDYVLLAGREYKPTYTTTNTWFPALPNRVFHVWPRGPAYNRTFRLTLITESGRRITGSYTTPSAGYPGVLNTSDIAASDPEYNKKVTDRVNAYNSAVNEWITTAAEGASPAGIRAGLKSAISAAQDAGSYSPKVLFSDADNAGWTMRQLSSSDPVAEIEVTDSGDGSLIRAVSQTIDSIDNVSPYFSHDRVVKVRPKDGDEETVTYLRSVAKSPREPALATLPVEVTWQETAGVVTTPTSAFLYGRIHRKEDGTESLIVGGNALSIDNAGSSFLGITLAAFRDAGLGAPDFLPSVCGDQITDPPPRFLQEGIDFLSLFQDRLVIGSGSTVFMSRPGDYFNWFRKSTLSVDDDDPIELLTYGSETDTIRAATTYDRNFVLFGDQRQYVINGRIPITPSNGAMIVQSAHENAVDADPVNSGNFVFYGRSTAGFTSLHQIQVGFVQDSPESYEVSQQLDTYIPGKPVQLIPFTAPNTVVVRTNAKSNGVYLYSYLDNASAQERLFDSWSRWEWDDKVGTLMGISSENGNLLVYTLREAVDGDGIMRTWMVCDRFELGTDLSPRPYLDSARQIAALSDVGSINTETEPEGIYAAFGQKATTSLLGVPMTELDDLDEYEDKSDLWFGYGYSAYVTPTNPYPRDRKDNAIVNGRMTLGRIAIDLAQSGGIKVTITTVGGEQVVLDNKARIVGYSNNVLGKQPISTYTATAMIGREVRQCTYTLEAQSWLPLTVTGIEWTGQYFNNARRL